MFLQKTLIGIALSAIVTPGIMQTTKLANQSMQVIHHTTKFKNHLEPFNPGAFVSSETDGNGNYYAYYRNTAFPPLHNGDAYGYAFYIGGNSSVYLTSSWNYMKSIGENPLGGVITYMTGYFLHDEHFQTPWSGKWIYSKDFHGNAYEEEIIAISYAFATTNEAAYYNVINNAIAHGQTVDFFCYSEVWDQRSHNEAKVTVANAQTGQSYTTEWYQYE